MATQTISTEQVLQSISTLPPEKLKLVYELVQKLRVPEPKSNGIHRESKQSKRVHALQGRVKRTSSMGKYALVPGTTEEFMLRKRQDTLIEDRYSL